MNKILTLFIITLWSSFSLCMNKYIPSFNNMVTTLYDKYNPTTILEELEKNGVSKNDRELMTQEHRVNRVIPHHIEKDNTEKLAQDIIVIMTKKFPISHTAKKTALTYLCNKRATFEQNKSVLERIVSAIDLINPAQIMHDFEKGQLYTKETLEIETRVNKCMQSLINEKKIKELQALMFILGERRKNERTAIIPQERLIKEMYQLIRTNEKEIIATKKILLESFKSPKNESDNEEEKKDKN